MIEWGYDGTSASFSTSTGEPNCGGSPYQQNQMAVQIAPTTKTTTPATDRKQSTFPTADTKKRVRETLPDACNYFRECTRYTEDGKVWARCNFCHKDFEVDNEICGTTSTIGGHLKRCLKNPYLNETYQAKVSLQQAKVSLQQKTTSGFEDNEAPSENWVFSQENTRKALAYMIIVDGLPFSTVDREGFRQFFSAACPSFEIPPRSAVIRDCFLLYLEEKAKLKSFLKNSCQRISFSIDIWTSEQEIKYVCLTGHFVDNDWILQKKVLNFCPVPCHKGEAIGQAIENCMLDWGIDKVFCITVDNASCNDNAIGYLRNRLNRWGTSLAGGKYLHMRCVAQVINLVVGDALEEMGTSVARVRAAVQFIRQCPARLKKFNASIMMERIESKRMLYVDVPTRWDSTYMMLDTAEKFEKAFRRYEEEDPRFKAELKDYYGGIIGLPREEDWKTVKHLTKFLDLFYKLSLHLSGSLHVTANVAFDEISAVYGTLKEWQESDDLDLCVMAKGMKDKFDKYWGNTPMESLLIYIAAILDPRLKLDYVEYALSEMHADAKGDMGKLVKDAIFELFAQYKIRSLEESSASGSPTSSEISLLISESGINSPKVPFFMNKFKKFKIGTEGMDTKSELDKYLAEEVEPCDPTFNILSWWKLNSRRFPILSIMVRDILAVPVRTVASECTFSMGGPVLDSFRSSLTPKICQAMMCARDWLRSSDTPVCMDEDLDQLADLEKDLINFGSESTTVGI